MLESNRTRVHRLTGLEIWLFIVGRVLVAFEIGALAMAYYPAVASTLAWAAVLVLGSRGLLRRPPEKPTA